MKAEDDIWNDLFHGCAWAAFLEQAHAQQGWPDREQTRKRAFRLYEEALAERNRAKDKGPDWRNLNKERKCYEHDAR
jgi:hypothetical protein